MKEITSEVYKIVTRETEAIADTLAKMTVGDCAMRALMDEIKTQLNKAREPPKSTPGNAPEILAESLANKVDRKLEPQFQTLTKLTLNQVEMNARLDSIEATQEKIAKRTKKLAKRMDCDQLAEDDDAEPVATSTKADTVKPIKHASPGGQVAQKSLADQVAELAAMVFAMQRQLEQAAETAPGTTKERKVRP